MKKILKGTSRLSQAHKFMSASKITTVLTLKLSNIRKRAVAGSSSLK